jgi:hypothetical protein
MATESDVFISYAEDTKPLAEELTKALEKQRFQAWADFKDLQPGARWRDEIERSLDKASWLLILVSPRSRATGWQEAEWRAALTKVWSDSDKRLWPVVVGGTEPPPFLWSWVSLTIDPAKEPANWTRRVLDVLRWQPSEGMHDLRDENRARRRLDEIGRAAEQFDKDGVEEKSPSGS